MPPITPNARGRWIWAALATCVALIPFSAGLTGSRVFYIRDLSSYFWARYLWLRHAWMAGEWPLWDPYVGAGQAAYSDALHQLFLPPAILARLIGGEVLGFNLWVLLPFPLAAFGAWLFFSRRFSARASALGAVAFAASGPIVSTGNMPNFSWAVAALPWILWATDRLVVSPSPRAIATLALAVSMQCLAGEPVTFFTTLIVVGAYALWIDGPSGTRSFTEGFRSAVNAGAASALGMGLAAIQVVPMVAAARLADRSDAITPDLWSLRPTALLEVVWMHLFGNYFETQSISEVPWLPLVYTGREPLLFSIYLGVPLLALALAGLAGTAPRRWRLFWLTAGFISVVAAFGSYTPIYPILRDHVPPFGSFRFPVKYISVACLAVAAGATAAWDMLAAWSDHAQGDDRRRALRARSLTVSFVAMVAMSVAAFSLACVFVPARIATPLAAYATALGDASGTAAAFMLRTVPSGAVPLLLLSCATAALFALATATGRTRYAQTALSALALLTAGDLVVRGRTINPAFDPKYVAEPQWLSYTMADPNAKLYVGGKSSSSLDRMDIDGSRAYTNASGLTGSASRAALNIQAAFYPSAWHAREMLSYDLPVIWPKLFNDVSKRFFEAKAGERERFLQRTGVRYRVLPQRRAGTRTPLTDIPQFWESLLFDFGDGVAPRAAIVPDARLVPQVDAQVDALFADGWDSNAVALVDRDLPATGQRKPAVPSSVRFVEDRSNRSIIDAGVGSGGGYLVVLDTYADDWHASVDGQPATIARANGLFRAVRLAEGSHRVEFVYRPRALQWGAAVTAVSFLMLIGTLLLPHVRRQDRRPSMPTARDVQRVA